MVDLARRKIDRIIAIGTIGPAVCFFAVAMYFYLDTRSFVARARETEATVVGTELVMRKSARVPVPIGEFSVPGGKARLSPGTTPRYPIGARFAVLYEPAAPDAARANDFFSLWLWPLMFGGISLGQLLFGAIILVLRAKGVGAGRPPISRA